MRIIFLNTWQGRSGAPIKKFIKEESGSTDIFCFQEVSPDFFKLLSSWLPQHEPFYEAGKKLAIDGRIYGQVIFTKPYIEVHEKGKIRLYNQLINDIGFLLYQHLSFNGSEMWLGNIHGKTNPGSKRDTESRLKQSRKIIDFFAGKKTSVIFGGDFNLLPDTESIKKIEEAGYKNLIKDFGVKTTRNRLSWEQFRKQPNFVKQHFADYVFTSPEVKVKGFEVPHVEISDHLPLILDVEV